MSMGMFDNVDVPEMKCPGCGGDLGFQTKSFGNSLSTYTVQEVMDGTSWRDEFGQTYMTMLGGCDSCRWWVEVKIKSGNDPIDIEAPGSSDEGRGLMALRFDLYVNDKKEK